MLIEPTDVCSVPGLQRGASTQRLKQMSSNESTVLHRPKKSIFVNLTKHFSCTHRPSRRLTHSHGSVWANEWYTVRFQCENILMCLCMWHCVTTTYIALSTSMTYYDSRRFHFSTNTNIRQYSVAPNYSNAAFRCSRQTFACPVNQSKQTRREEERERGWGVGENVPNK